MSVNVHYKNESIGKGSEAYDMWEAKDFKRLDRHLRELDEKEVALIKRYQRSDDGKETVVQPDARVDPVLGYKGLEVQPSEVRS